MAFYSGPLLFNLLILIVPWYYFARSAIARSNIVTNETTLRFEVETLLQECLVNLHWIIHVIMFSLEKVRWILGVYLSGACTVS